MSTIPECELPTIRVEEPRSQATGSESWMDVDVDDDDEMPPLVEKPVGHDTHSGPDEVEDNEDSLPEISVASYSSLPSGGYTFIADGGESSVAGAVSTTSFQMPGTLSIRHTPAGPTTSSHHEFSFSINNNASHSNSNSVSPLPSPLTDVAEEFTNIITNDIASAPRGRTKHHLLSDADDGPAGGDGEVGGAGGYIPRPPNAFILFRSSFIRSQKISGKVEGNHSTLSKIIGMYWRTLPTAERAEWEAKARIAQDEHRKRYPDWRFRPGSSKNTSQRGRGRRTKGGARKGRLKTKDGGGEEDTPTELDERVVAVRHDTTITVDKGKRRECDRVSVSAKDADKGRGRDKVEADASPQKISILIPQAPSSSKKPYHLRDRSSKSSSTSFSNDHAVQPSEYTSVNVTALPSNPSTSTNYTSVTKPFSLPIPIAKTNVSPDAKPQSQPTREDLRIKHITRLLVEGKEGAELERELERWERGEDPEISGPNSSDTERGGTPFPPWSPEVPTPASDRYPNTPLSSSTTDKDTHTQRMVPIEVAPDRMSPQSSLTSNQLQIQQFVGEERVSSGKKRSSSAPAPGTRVPFPAQNPSSPYQPNFSGHNPSESIADVNTGESEHNSQLQVDSSSISTWDDSYDDYFNGYEHQQQQSSSPFSSSPLSAGGQFQQEQSQRQWTYPPYPSQSVVSVPETDHGVHQYTQASPFPSKNSHRHTRTRSHLHPIQSFPLAGGDAMLQPPNSSTLHPSQDHMMTSPTPSSLTPVTPSSAPPGYGGRTQYALERNANMPRRGSIAFPITPSSRSSVSSSDFLVNRKTLTWRNDLGSRNHHGGGIDSGSEALTWETAEVQRGQWFRTEPTGGETPQHPRYELTYREETQESVYPSPGTRDMGWVVSQHPQHSFQLFSPSDDVGPSSGMNWEQADQGRQGMVTCIVDPYLLASGDGEETEKADPPPTSSYSSLSGWAGEPVVRLSPPNYYDRKDSQSSVWEVDDDVSFGFGVGFGRRGG
ncbi:hypothetical protein E1B28_006101 [Marasmius oreades]|uniref:HMG box domain-containing protein n=1 Tax=Marasmius oreades TaxID=181124 RepID=A0A9P7S4N3_9AGAR|nr:uncharacterized protein E1B28_006101 [Marasmius oreades]KAG7095339.1 hypothetical protein E1B28_006101 [Marasmius oreades]